MKLETYDADTITVTLTRQEIAKLTQIAKLAAAQYDALDEVILDLSHDEVKAVASRLLEIA